MPRAELPSDIAALWPNCTVPDCANKACLGLSETLCTPHYFKLPMDQEGNAIYPDRATRRKVIAAIQAAQKIY